MASSQNWSSLRQRKAISCSCLDTEGMSQEIRAVWRLGCSEAGHGGYSHLEGARPRLEVVSAPSLDHRPRGPRSHGGEHGHMGPTYERREMSSNRFPKKGKSLVSLEVGGTWVAKA